MTSNKEAAAALAVAGMTVFPCGPDKKPRCPWKDVVVRPAWQVSMAWSEDDLPAIPVGKHGMVVIDCDVAKPNRPDGRAAFQSYASGKASTCRARTSSLRQAAARNIDRADYRD